jgi:hypothetical protein
MEKTTDQLNNQQAGLPMETVAWCGFVSYCDPGEGQLLWALKAQNYSAWCFLPIAACVLIPGN